MSDVAIQNCEFRLPGEDKWMLARTRWPMTEAEQDRRLRTKWGADIEIRRKRGDAKP